ncbi:MAG: transporter substrate-binding domain-containing protein [Halopseudomonas sabulinigri]|tara:strand:+ start:19268 stop:20008 length:741 start_codon:yes stop_codon:yes gene_type:complete
MKAKLWLFLFPLLMCRCALAEPLDIVSEAWPPYIYEDRGQLRGVDYEVTNRVLSQLGYQARWRLMPWRRALYNTSIGRADAILDISPNPQRRQEYIFSSEPLSISESVLFYRKDRPHRFTELHDLKGLKVGVSAGYVYGNPEFMSADYFSREPTASAQACLSMLMLGRIDMVMMNKRAGLFTLRQLALEDKIDHHPLVVSSGPLFLAFHQTPELRQLSERFSTALSTFKGSNEYLQILQRYGLSER